MRLAEYLELVLLEKFGIDSEKIWNVTTMRVINGLIIKVYNWIISRKIINTGGKFSSRIRQMFFHNICFPCTAMFGFKNADRLLYVIRCPQETMGFFGVYNYVVSHLKIAEEMQAEPIVDWKYYPNGATTTNDSIGKINTWEWFFEPISTVDIDDVYHSKRVIMSDGMNYASFEELMDKNSIQESYAVIKKYIKPRKLFVEEINAWKKKYDLENALGVLARGTIFITNRPSDHSTIPTIDDLVEYIKKVDNANGKYKYIFLATEDETIKTTLKKEFSNRLIYSQESTIERVGDRWSSELFYLADKSEHDELKIQIAKEYMLSIYLLSECGELIAPVVGGTLGAVRIKGGYRNLYLVGDKIETVIEA